MTGTAPPRRAVIIYESMFGNTATIAAAVAEGLRQHGVETAVTDVSDAPAPNQLVADLVVLGAPTHALSLSRTTTRSDAIRQGAAPRRARTGIREWLAGSSGGRVEPLVAIFDTRVAKVRRLPLGAAQAAARLARRHGWQVVDTAAFAVIGTPGPLVEGEAERASGWGRELAARITRPSSAPG